MLWRRIHGGRLIFTGIAYRAIIIVVQTIFFYALTSEWRWAIGTSLGWNVVNVICYYLYHWVILKMFRFGKERNVVG